MATTDGEQGASAAMHACEDGLKSHFFDSVNDTAALSDDDAELTDEQAAPKVDVPDTASPADSTSNARLSAEAADLEGKTAALYMLLRDIAQWLQVQVVSEEILALFANQLESISLHHTSLPRIACQAQAASRTAFKLGKRGACNKNSAGPPSPAKAARGLSDAASAAASAASVAGGQKPCRQGSGASTVSESQSIDASADVLPLAETCQAPSSSIAASAGGEPPPSTGLSQALQDLQMHVHNNTNRAVCAPEAPRSPVATATVDVGAAGLHQAAGNQAAGNASSNAQSELSWSEIDSDISPVAEQQQAGASEPAAEEAPKACKPAAPAEGAGAQLSVAEDNTERARAPAATVAGSTADAGRPSGAAQAPRHTSQRNEGAANKAAQDAGVRNDQNDDHGRIDAAAHAQHDSAALPDLVDAGESTAEQMYGAALSHSVDLQSFCVELLDALCAEAHLADMARSVYMRRFYNIFDRGAGRDDAAATTASTWCGVAGLPAEYLVCARDCSFIARHAAALAMRTAMQPLADLSALGVCAAAVQCQLRADCSSFEWRGAWEV